MPPKAKRIENMTKNMTLAEEQARIVAEAATIPQRESLNIEPPSYVAKGDRVALRYWTQVLNRLSSANVDLLDDLDSEVLGLYCSMLSRRDLTCKMRKKLERQARSKDVDAKTLLGLIEQIQAVDSQLRSQERLILQYADRLGLTPASRAGLAKKKATEAADDPDADLFG